MQEYLFNNTICIKANSPDREWEAFDDINFGQKMKDDGCKDIAAQLIEENSFINVNYYLNNVFFEFLNLNGQNS